MATLIQSKQIQGVVTASVIEGDFNVQGDIIATGSNAIFGDITGSSVSASYIIGDGSGITGINYSQIGNTPVFLPGQNVTITSSSNEITFHAVLDGTGSDVQNLSISGDQLTIIGGNSITIPTGSNVSEYSDLTNVPTGIVSASAQIIELLPSGVVSGSFISQLPAGTISGSSQITISESQISDLTHYTNTDVQTYIDSKGIVSGSVVAELPSGTISGSSQITITESQISDLSHLSDSNIKAKLDTEGVLSGSFINQLPVGTISGSTQVTISESQISDLTHYTDSNVKTKLDTEGVLSGSQQVVDSLPVGTISGSTQVTISESQISDLTHYTDSNVKTKLDTEGVLSGSLLTQLPSGLISGSNQLPSGVVSGSSQVTITQSQISDLAHTDISALNTFTSSYSTESASFDSRIDIEKGRVDAILDSAGADTDTFAEIVTLINQVDTTNDNSFAAHYTSSRQRDTSLEAFSSSIQSEVDTLTAATSSYITELPDGTISGSAQISITQSQISDLTHYTDSNVKTKLDTEGVLSGSLLTQLPTGTISGSSQITISESQISDLTHYTDSNVKTKLEAEGVVSGSAQVTITDTTGFNTFSSSVETSISTEKSRVDAILLSSDADKDSFAEIVTLINQVDTTNDNAFASHYTASNQRIGSLEGFTSSIDTTIKTKLEADGIISSSTQILGGSEIVSSSTQVESLLPDGTISGSSQVESLLPDGTVSGSVQLFGGSNVLSSSIEFTPFSSSIDTRTVTLETIFSSSVSNNLIILNDFSASHVIESQSLDNRLDGLEGGAALYYDLSNTVWNNKYIKSGSGLASTNDISFDIPFTFQLNSTRRLSYELNDVVYITNFDRDIVIHALVSSSYDAGTEKVGFNVVDVNGITGSVKINDPYWIITKQSSGFVQLNDYLLDSASFDTRLLQSFTSASNHDTRLIESFASASNHDTRLNVVETTYATTQSVDTVSSSLDTKMDNLQLSQSIALTGLLSGSVQITLQDTTGYVTDENIDHTTITIAAGSGLIGGGDIAESRNIQLDNTSSFFQDGVRTVLTDDGVVKQSTLDADIIGTDYSQSVDNRINAFAAASVPTGTVSGSQQITNVITDSYISASAFQSGFGTGGGTSDFTQLTNVPSGLVSGSIQVLGGTGIASGSIQSEVDALIAATSSYLTSETDSQTLSIDGNDLTITGGNTITLPVGSEVPAGTVSGSDQVLGGTGILSGSIQSEVDALIAATSSYITEIPQGTISGSDQLPTGTISGSSQVTITESQISDLSHTNIDALKTFTGSIQSEVNALTAATSSYLTSETDSQTLTIDGSDLTITGGNTITLPSTSLPSGVISGSSQITNGSDILSGSIVAGTNVTLTQEGDSLYISASGGDVTYDGNRTISNDKLGDLFTDTVNPGTSGSVQEFLNAVFYPNSAPSITTGNQTIAEYTTNGSTIVTVAGTDPEGQSLTFSTAASYTDNLVSVASNGLMTLAALPTSASFNTSAVGGGLGHLVTVKVTDTFNTSTEKDIYIIVTPNEAPKFRETSVGGTIITSVTANLNENSVNNTLVKRVYFTDVESDTITITTGSIDNEHFDVDIQSTYLDIKQNSGSLDYEQLTSYTFSITASDEHYEASEDADSVSYLPITINVVDNLVPTINNQTLSSINENSSNGASVDSISAADNESDTITFSNFTLTKLELDNVDVTQGTYSGASQLTDPHENPFQMDSSGNVTRKSGVYLNSDLINEYQYTVIVKDGFNNASSPATITIPITDDTPATLTDNWSAGPYIIESAVTGNTIRISSNGRTGDQADYNSNQSGTWASSNSVVSINSNGNLSLGSDVRGNYVSGNTITSTITFTNAFGTTTTDTLNLSVAENSAPTAVFSATTFNNTNQATGSANMETVTISDAEGNTPYGLTLSGTNASSFNAVPQNSDSSSWELQVASDLSAGSYSYNVSVSDEFGKSTAYNSRTITINQADDGSMTTNGTLYVIESAQSGNIFTNSNGRSGTIGEVSVSYSTNYGVPVAKEFTSSNGLIAINTSSGVLSVGTAISGSASSFGDTITSTIGWEDQYGNTDTDTITVNVAKNNAPTVSSTQTYYTNTNQATGSSEIVRLNLTDTEGDSILAAGLSWSNYNSTYFTPSNSTGVMKLLVNSTSVPAAEYDYTASIEDVHGFHTTLHSGSVTIAQSDNGTLGGDTSIYSIESAESESVYRDATGYNNGNAAQVSVTYSPSDGSPVVQQYTSSREGVTIDSSGNLTTGYHFSGSVINTDYTSTAIATDSTNSTLYGKSLHSHGLKIVQGAAISGQSAVPDLFTEKVAQVVKLMITGSGADIDDVAQANMIGTLKGETGTWHSGSAAVQRVLRGAGTDYSVNPLNDSNYSSYSGLQTFQDSHSTKDMIWYLNSSADSGSGDADITEVVEHLMHTIHSYGVRGGVDGSVNGLSWITGMDSDWKTRELFLAFKQAVDNSVFSLTGYGDEDYNTEDTFELAVIEYLYLLNFNMWEYSSLWDGGSLSPEWNDNSRTPSGIQTYNPLGYALYNKYIEPVLTKPSLSSLRSIFQDGDVGNPAIAGSSGYTPEVGSGLISNITFRDQYGNVGSGSVTATVFGNSAPSATFTSSSNYESDNATSGSDAGALVVTDTESNSPFTFTIAGTDGDKFNITGTSSPFEIQPTGSLAAGTYSVNITVTDNYNESVTLTNESIVVDASATLTTGYIYYSNYGSDAGFAASYNALMGASSVNSDVPPQVTGYTANTASPYYKLKAGDVGSSSITLAGSKNATLGGTISGSDFNAAIRTAGNMTWGTGVQTLFVIPSGSTMTGIPTSMTDGTGGSTTGEYILVEYADGVSAPLGATPSIVHSIVLDSTKDGYDEWFVIGANQQNSATNMRLQIIPSSGSISDF